MGHKDKSGLLAVVGRRASIEEISRCRFRALTDIEADVLGCLILRCAYLHHETSPFADHLICENVVGLFHVLLLLLLAVCCVPIDLGYTTTSASRSVRLETVLFFKDTSKF